MTLLSPATFTDEDDGAPLVVHDVSAQKGHKEAHNVPNETGTLTLMRKAALCAGLMGSDAMGVFTTLNTMPLLQAFGSPVYLLTLPGVVSASCGLVFVPLMGWLADMGSNSQRRKKLIAIVTFCVGLLGMGLNLAATLLSIEEGPTLSNLNTTVFVSPDDPVNYTSSNSVSSSLLDKQENLAAFLKSSQSQTGLSNESKLMAVTDETGSLGTATGDVLGLPVLVLVSMAGFILMDLGYDLSNSAVKALVLTYSAPADHLSLLVTGAVMAALGGCSTSVSGLVDLGSLLPLIDPVYSQAIVQLSTLILLSILCCTCSVLSTPTIPTPDQALSSGQLHTDPLGGEEEEEKEGDKQSEGEGVDNRRGSRAVPWQEASDTEFFATLTPAEDLMSRSTQGEHSLVHTSTSRKKSVSQSGGHHCHPSRRANSEEANEKTPLLVDNSAITRELGATKPASRDSCLSSLKCKLVVVWLAAFFNACGLFCFSIILSDYLGKVVYGGDPQPEAGSEDYSRYQQGMRTASLCALVMVVSYLSSAMCQNRVLAAVSPKSEYVVASLSFLVLIVVMHQMASLPAVIVCSVVAGVNRTALCTVPFVLATQLCQQPPAKTLSPEEERGEEKEDSASKFGSMMALMTCALPSAYLVTNSFIGPLVDATGDPSSPLMIAMVCLAVSAVTMCCFKA